ncbi:hypothetical protein PI124_g4056 [Phytophthora idaei]|nr:hypothetical protein PI125_g2027 [Phytophthora idaei]KAG3168495.1 hypothetical protein PI126_g3270 [Phytophthora idaei]KAG3251340.1 hypothetical protein PI124_g4056 [Phytophthora idaei]
MQEEFFFNRRQAKKYERLMLKYDKEEKMIAGIKGSKAATALHHRRNMTRLRYWGLLTKEERHELKEKRRNEKYAATEAEIAAFSDEETRKIATRDFKKKKRAAEIARARTARKHSLTDQEKVRNREKRWKEKYEAEDKKISRMSDEEQKR